MKLDKKKYELDNKKEWCDPMAWEKANPGLNRIKKLDTYVGLYEHYNEYKCHGTGGFVVGEMILKNV